MRRPTFELVRARPERRLLGLSAALSVAIHALVIALAALAPPEGRARDTILLILDRPPDDPAIAASAETAQEEETAAGTTDERFAQRQFRRSPIRGSAEDGIALASPTLTPSDALPAAAIPRAAPDELAARSALFAPMMPLVATAFGIGRRPVVRDPARIARMRAESLINASIASLVESKPAPSAGPVGLAGGGVTIGVPWGGFVRADRADEKWREGRCRGKESGKADKPGEAEARRAQCS